MNLNKLNKKGLTLIELMIAIVIIAIMTGITISVINPARQRAKSQQAVTKGNVAKLCEAFWACINSEPTGAGANCATATMLDVTAPTTPTGQGYTIGATGITATNNGCTYACGLTGAITVTGGASCYVN